MVNRRCGGTLLLLDPPAFVRLLLLLLLLEAEERPVVVRVLVFTPRDPVVVLLPVEFDEEEDGDGSVLRLDAPEEEDPAEEYDEGPVPPARRPRRLLPLDPNPSFFHESSSDLDSGRFPSSLLLLLLEEDDVELVL